MKKLPSILLIALVVILLGGMSFLAGCGGGNLGQYPPQGGGSYSSTFTGTFGDYGNLTVGDVSTASITSGADSAIYSGNIVSATIHGNDTTIENLSGNLTINGNITGILTTSSAFSGDVSGNSSNLAVDPKYLTTSSPFAGDLWGNSSNLRLITHTCSTYSYDGNATSVGNGTSATLAWTENHWDWGGLHPLDGNISRIRTPKFDEGIYQISCSLEYDAVGNATFAGYANMWISRNDSGNSSDMLGKITTPGAGNSGFASLSGTYYLYAYDYLTVTFSNCLETDALVIPENFTVYKLHGPG